MLSEHTFPNVTAFNSVMAFPYLHLWKRECLFNQETGETHSFYILTIQNYLGSSWELWFIWAFSCRVLFTGSMWWDPGKSVVFRVFPGNSENQPRLENTPWCCVKTPSVLNLWLCRINLKTRKTLVSPELRDGRSAVVLENLHCFRLLGGVDTLIPGLNCAWQPEAEDSQENAQPLQFLCWVLGLAPAAWRKWEMACRSFFSSLEQVLPIPRNLNANLLG